MREKIALTVTGKPQELLLREDSLLREDAQVFSILDVKEAHWDVRLDETSSKLTTMIAPFFPRFVGLKVLSEIF